MEAKDLDKIFDTFIKITKVYRDKLNHVDSCIFMCDIATLKKQILNSENKMCVEHGCNYPCSVCDGESDS